MCFGRTHARTPWALALRLLTIFESASAVSCVGARPASPTEVRPAVVEPVSEDPFWTGGEIDRRCSTALERAQAAHRETTLRSGEPSALTAFDTLLRAIEDAAAPMALVASVHPDEAARLRAEACERMARAYYAQVTLDPEVYAALASVAPDERRPGAARFLEKVLLELRLSGVDRDAATREKLGVLQEHMLETGQDFSRNIREDTRFIRVRRDDLEGLPRDFIAAHPPDEDGLLTITTDYPDYFPVQTYAKNPKTRRALAEAFLSRAHPANEEVLKGLLRLRHEYATTLGYDSWADYTAQDKMAGSAEVIQNFTDEVARIASPRMEEDLELLLSEKRALEPSAERIEEWDRFFFIERVRRERFGVDGHETRAYFPYAQVEAGILELYAELFGLSIVPEPSAPVWHERVKRYRVEREGRTVGRFYLDMHPRPGKLKHAAMFPIRTGTLDGPHPEAALVCNFPDPAEGLALLDHGQVVTFFHELGHLVHHLFASGSPWFKLSGLNLEWDFVEAPSQLLEEWAWSPEVLARFARHHETGAPIPPDLVHKMRAASEVGKGVHVTRQVFYQALSFYLHHEAPGTIDLPNVTRRLQERYSPYPPIEGTHVYASFGHLNGYSSMYYMYQWSLARAKDIFTRFEAAGLMDQATFAAYREAILVPGSTKPARELVADFLGRPSSLDAYERWLSK